MEPGMTQTWESLDRGITRCRKCPRLIDHCRSIGKTKRKAYVDDVYWAKPVPNFGSESAKLLIVGLAPGAHGANRTGRMFTGDRSGDWLYRSLHRNGFATQSDSTCLDDGLQLINCAITAVCHCAPPDNKPMREEIINCQPWLDATVDLLRAKAFVALGKIAWDATIDMAKRRNWYKGARPKFTHGVEIDLDDRKLIGSFHPSQQNTFTGRLTEEMLDTIFHRAALAVA